MSKRQHPVECHMTKEIGENTHIYTPHCNSNAVGENFMNPFAVHFEILSHCFEAEAGL